MLAYVSHLHVTSDLCGALRGAVCLPYPIQDSDVWRHACNPLLPVPDTVDGSEKVGEWKIQPNGVFMLLLRDRPRVGRSKQSALFLRWSREGWERYKNGLSSGSQRPEPLPFAAP